jgi:hypothetical protein
MLDECGAEPSSQEGMKDMGIKRFGKLTGRQRWIVGGAALAIAGIAIVSRFYPPPSEKYTGGTMKGIQKAEKYQAAQMSASDIHLKDPQLQALLQDDKVRAVMNNPNFKALMQNAQFAELTKDSHAIGLVNSGDLGALGKDGAYAELVHSAQFLDLMKNAQFAELMKEAQFVGLMNDAQFAGLMRGVPSGE